jgi:hypothetical protein
LYDDGVPKLLSTNNFIFGKNNYAKNSNQILSVQVGGPNIAYSWQKFSTNWSEINSTNELSLQNLSTSNIANYRVSYTNEFGSSTGNFSINVFEKVFINKQPESKIIVSGETGILDVQAEGALPLSYQWMFNGTNLTSNTLYYSGFNERQLYIKNAKSELEGLYSVKVSNENSYENSIAAKIYVKNDPPKFCSFSNLFITKYWGESFDISGDYEGSLPITNQWYFSNESLSSLVKVTNQTQKYYTLTNIDNNSVGYYTMSATNKFGTTYSNIANQYNPIAYWTYLDVNPNLYLKDSPKSAFGVSSLSLSIPVEVYGSGLSFQWYKDKNAITTQKNKALTFNSLQKTDAGQYYLKSSQIINGNTVYIDTPPFTLSVIDKLLITNSTLNLSATITNTGLVRYSPFSLNINTSYDATIKPNNSGVIWYKSGKNDSNFLQISNETGLSFLIPGVTTGDIGRYRAKLINPLYTGDFEYSKTFYLTGVCTLALSKDIAVYSGNSNSNILIEQLTNNAETAIQYGYGQFMLSGVVDGDEPLTYKWKSGEKLTALIDISNATGIIYTGNSKVNKSAFYSLDVTNKYNTSTYSEYLNIVIPAKITGLNLVKKYGGTILNKILITDEQKLNDINYQIKLSDYFNTEAGYNRCYEITALFDGNPNEAKFRKETDNISFNVQPITNTTNLTSKFNTNLSYNNIIYNYITNSICFANASIQQAGVYCMYGLNRFTSTTGKINIDFFNSSPEIINCAYFLEKNQTAPAAGFSYKLISSTLDQTDKLISSTSANSNNALSWNTTSNTIISALPKDALMVPKGVLSNKDKDYYMFLENSNSYLEIAATGSGDENYRVEWFLNDVDIKTATTTNSISNISIANLNISTTGKNYSSLLSISNFQTSNVGIYSAKISSNNYSTSTIKYFEIKIAKKPQITNNTVLYQYDQTGLKIISPSLTGYIKESGTLYAEISAIGTPTLKSPPVAGMMGVYGVNWSLKKVTGISGGKNLYSDYVFGVENRSTSNAAGHTNKYVFTASTGMNGLYYPVISTDYGSDTGNAFCVAVIDYPEVLCWRATQASIAAAATDPRVSSTYNISDATYNSNFNPQVIQAGSGFYLSIITNPPLITQSANNAIMPLIYSYMFSGTGGISTFRYTGTNNSNYDIFRREMSIENSGLYKMKITPSGNYNNAFTGVETNWLSLGVDYKIESQFSNIVHDCFVYNTGTKTYVNKTTKDANGNLNYLNPSKIILNEGECVYLSGCVLPTTIPTAYPQVYKWLFYPKDGFRINIPVYPYPIKSPYTTGVSGKITSTGFATTLPELKRCVDFTGSGLNGFGFYGRDIGIYQLYSEQYYPDRKKLLCTKFFEPICIDVLTKPSGYAFIGGTGPYSNFYPGTFFEEYSRTGIYIGENISGSFYFGATDCASTKDITIDIFTGNPYVSFTGNDNIKISGQTSLQYSEYEKNLQDSAVREPKIVRINYSGLKFGQDPIVFTPYFTTDKKVSLYGKNFTILVTGSVFISKQVDSTMDLYEKQSGSQYINASGSPVLTYQWWKSGKTNSLVTTNTEIDGVSTNKINFKSPSLSATGIYFPVVTQTFKNINNGYVYTGIVTGSSLKLNVIPQGPKFIYNSTTFKTGTFWASTGEKFLISGSGSGFSPFQYQFFKNQAQYKNISGTEQDKQISGYSGFGWSKIIETGDTACWEFSIKNQNYINNVDLNACYRTGMCLKVMATPNIIYTSNNYYVPSGYAAEIIIKTTFEAINEPSIYYKWFKSGSGNNFIQLTNTSGTTFKISGYSGVSGSGSKVLSSGSNFYIRIPSEENSKSVYPNNYFGTYKISGSGVYDSTNPKTVFNFEKTFNVLTNAATTGQPVWAGGKSGETSLIWFGYGNNYFSGNLNSGIYKVYLWGAGGGASELSLSDSDGGTSYWNGGSNGASFSGCYNLITGKYFELSIGQGGLANWTDLATRRGAIAGEQRNPAAKGANGIAGISGPTISSPNEAPTVTTGTITQITGIAANSPYQQLVLSSKAGKLPIDTGIKVAGGGGGGGTSFGLWVQSTGTGTKVMERFINVPGGGGAGAASKYMANQRDWIIGSVGGGVDKIDAQKGGGRRYIQNTVNSTGKYFHGGDGSFSANGGGGASAYLYDYAGDGGVGGAFSCYYSLLQSGATSYTGNCYSGTSVNYAYSLTQSKLYPSLAASIDPLNIVNEVYSIFSECWPGKGSVEQDGHHGAFVIVKLS